MKRNNTSHQFGSARSVSHHDDDEIYGIRLDDLPPPPPLPRLAPPGSEKGAFPGRVMVAVMGELEKEEGPLSTYTLSERLGLLPNTLRSSFRKYEKKCAALKMNQQIVRVTHGGWTCRGLMPLL